MEKVIEEDVDLYPLVEILAIEPSPVVGLPFLPESGFQFLADTRIDDQRDTVRVMISSSVVVEMVQQIHAYAQYRQQTIEELMGISAAGER